MLDTVGESTAQILVRFYENLMTSAIRSHHLPRDLYCAIGFTSYTGGEVSVVELLRQAAIALDRADEEHDIKLRAFRSSDRSLLQLQIESLMENPSITMETFD